MSSNPVRSNPIHPTQATKGSKKAKSTNPVLDYCLGVTQVTAGTLLTLTMLTSSVVAGGLVGLALSFRNLPDVRLLRNYIPSETSYIYDINGTLLSSIHDEANREVVDLNDPWIAILRTALAGEWSVDIPEVSTGDDVAYRDTHENWPVREGYGALVARLARHGIIASCRGNGLRVSFHAYNNDDDVTTVVRALEQEADLLASSAQPSGSANT